ncbi:hypothetical protein SBA7_1200003 [Candidatus Sulfotelmatobacter sp. SbA7]|nr:hypothetical protein SBA7_1200003 [Candidatus Sulfotelmatobacter sp. SbA7]
MERSACALVFCGTEIPLIAKNAMSGAPTGFVQLISARRVLTQLGVLAHRLAGFRLAVSYRY